MRNLISHVWLLPRRTAIALINIYQSLLSLDHSPLKALHPYGFCRHYPTCSEYGKQMLMQRGFIMGSLLLLKRLLSCHPWQRPSALRLEHVSPPGA